MIGHPQPLDGTFLAMSSPDRRAHRNRRHREVRAQIVPVSRLKRRRLGDPAAKAATLRELPELTLLEARQPATRAGCAELPRPCPFVSCRHHLYLDVEPTGALKLNFPDLEPWEMPARQSCALDVADDGRVTLEELGRLLNLTRERARQIELVAVARYRVAARGAGLDRLRRY